MYIVTAILKKCAKKDIKSGKTWCIYKHNAQHNIMNPQPKGWPKHYPSKERAERGSKMMKTFSKGSFSILCIALKERNQYDLIKRIEKKI